MSGGLHSITTIIKRLEAATSRLEDIATAGWTANAKPEGSNVKDETQTSSYIEAPIGASTPVPPPAMRHPPSVVAYDENVMNGKLRPFLELTKSFAGDSVVKMAGFVEEQYNEVRDLIITAAACQKPDDKGLEKLMAPFQLTIEAMSKHKEANRRDRDWSPHMTMIAEGAPSVAWVLSPTPSSQLEENRNTVQYYGDKVMKEFREKNPKHVEWVKAYVSILEETRKYVLQYHKTGLVWNPKGIPAAEYATKPKDAPAPPPPPPPPPVTIPPPAAAGGTAAVFAELNRGEEVTKNLRKVDRSEMTHKNPALRQQPGISPSSAVKKPIRPTKPQALMGKKPPKFALEGKAWVIEYQEDEKGLIVEEGQLNQAVNIFGCKNATIQITGKVNAVTIVNCTKTSVLVDSVVSQISVTKSPSFALQVTGSAPMIQLDSTDSGQIFLSKACLNAEITTAKCSAININIPVEGEEDGVFDEQPVPEMLRTVVKKGKLETTVVEHAG